MTDRTRTRTRTQEVQVCFLSGGSWTRGTPRGAPENTSTRFWFCNLLGQNIIIMGVHQQIGDTPASSVSMTSPSSAPIGRCRRRWDAPTNGCRLVWGGGRGRDELVQCCSHGDSGCWAALCVGRVWMGGDDIIQGENSIFQLLGPFYCLWSEQRTTDAPDAETKVWTKVFWWATASSAAASSRCLWNKWAHLRTTPTEKHRVAHS